MLKALSQSLLSFVFPVSCELCGSLLPARDMDGVCGSCQRSIPLIPSPRCPKCGRFSSEFTRDCALCRAETFYFDHAHAAVYYDGRAKELLRALKFSRKKRLTKTLLSLLERSIRENGVTSDADGVVAVPMHRALRFDRGFDQAELFARGVSKMLAKPFLSGALISGRPGKMQSKLGKFERKENVKDRFRLGRRTDLSGKKLLLVDDILTTGETASQCAKILKSSGAASVQVFAVARGC